MLLSIEVICPVYNGEQYLRELDKNIRKQKDVNIEKVTYILTRSRDCSEEILESLSRDYYIIEPEDFSHSLTREYAAMRSDADILVFITQDVDIRNDDWLEKLVKPLIEGEAEASFSRQITKYNNIEKYTRERNYPETSYVNTKGDLDDKGMMTFFFSDAASAIRADVFKRLNGYDGKKLVISEDMYIAYKLITNDYRIKYCADSIVWHSHQFTFRQLYDRYYDTGRFLKDNAYLDQYGTNKTGGGMALYVLKRAIEDRNIRALIRFIPDMGARFIGKQMGKRSV